MGLLRPPSGARLREIATRWSLVPRAAEQDDRARRERWRAFLDVYRAPMVRYAEALRRRLPAAAQRAFEAEDAVQAFLAACLEKGWLAAAAPGATRRFRALLQTLLRRWIGREADHALAARRRPPPGADPVSLEELLEGDDRTAAPDELGRAFDRDWAREMVARALERLRATHPAYAAAVERLMRAEAAAPREPSVPGITPVLKLRATRAFVTSFTDVLGETVATPDDLPEEWRHLAEHLP